MRNGYRRGLSWSLRRTAVPYGYALVIWTSGGVLIHRHGPPDLLSAYLFLAGAAAGVGIATLLAGRGDHACGEVEERWGAMASAAAAAAALGGAGLGASAVHGRAGYFAVALLSSLTYYLVRAFTTAYL
jgi:hypothetical protein